jgi:Tfp pilus assembly pilus retraction ATPase PilT
LAAGRNSILSEILAAMTEVLSLIRENRLYRISCAMQAGMNRGMVPMNQTLEERVHPGKISREAAVE